MGQARPFQGGARGVLVPGEFVRFDEPRSPALLWRELLLYANVPERGLTLVQGTQAEKRRRWALLGTLIRQAHTYYQAGSTVAGSSAALLYYYAFLSLAKAELLTWRPEVVVDREIHHGLTFRPTRAKTIAGDIVGVRAGVFRHLYEKRIGLAPARNLFKVKTLLRNIPQLGWELHQTGLGEGAARTAHVAVVVDATHRWALVTSNDIERLLRKGSTLTKIRQRFLEVELPLLQANDVFGRSLYWPLHGPYRLFESKRKEALLSPTLALTNIDVKEVQEGAASDLDGLLDPVGVSGDAALCPSLYSSEFVAMSTVT